MIIKRMEPFKLKDGEILATEHKVVEMYRSVVMNKKTGVIVREGPWTTDKFKCYDLFLKEAVG